MQISRLSPLRAAAILAACMAAVALLGAAGAPAKPTPKPKIVTINDFFFGPNAVTIHKGGAVKWVWSDLNSYPHDVHLKQGPSGLKDKGSYSTKTTAVTEAEFKKTFPTPGTYHFICTVHPKEMKLTVTVKK
ncbi:MAG TPA: plastocyanin/azurin family copper-binding protein [Solirubrobacterales bacterium]|nr:plastocyanin/azurin family copper-binding protein [Solirubrobacterales bacterium]